MVTATRGALRFDVHTWGPDDGVPVLLLHGFPQTGRSWEAVATLLAADGFRCIAPDQRGYSPGARPPRRRDYVLPELVADAIAVLDDVVGPGSRAHVVGHDWGAAVAWSLAARDPERVATLTAVSVPPPRAFLRSLLTSRQGLASWYMYVFQLPRLPERLLGAPGRLRALLRRTGLPPAAADRDAAALADPDRLTAALNWYRALFLAPPSFGAKVSVPTRFVWSTGDTALTRQSTLHAQAEVTGPYEFVELPGVSHWIPDEVPEQLAEIVATHAKNHPA
ncbi:Pimeloyl-ACP methyl ester carboxylesterase [Pseudonocardia thermophila]|uniref:Pimeloyl-ACP methyl ester carboxylesterase n=1 Tax=Pseudonocardia thermophila TaxID=1848 RepID=A0A1M7B4M5_PSETH|nr:Pimeloyl-ACP methyl ester carboxylesterase [Pseudonocardia thermophila]